MAVSKRLRYEVEALCDAIDTAARAGVPDFRVWRYFCGICWNMIRQRQEIARALIELEAQDG